MYGLEILFKLELYFKPGKEIWIWMNNLRSSLITMLAINHFITYLSF